MTDSKVIRDWLGIYVLVLTAVVGGYMLLVPDTLMPLESDQRTAAFEIIIPFLLGQLTVVFRYFGTATSQPDNSLSQPDKNPLVPVPMWAVKLPPVIATVLLLVAFVMMAVGGIRHASWILSPAQFKGLFTFVVALLNASSVLVMSRYFETAGASKAKEAVGQGANAA